VTHGTRSVAAGGLTIGEAARRAGLTRKAVRLYEARGLLPPVERTESGYRLYGEHDLLALRFISQARALGLGLEEIHAIMTLRRAGIPPSEDVIGLLKTRLGAVERRISELHSLRHGLAQVLAAATSRADRGEDARLCRILDEADQ
jgi:MerR family transcriptional regulator, copper efflux regulator